QMVGKAALMEALEAAAELGDTAKIAELLATLDELRPGEFSPLLQALRARFRARLPGRDAHAEFSVAEQLYRDLEMLFHLAVTQLEHAEWLVAEGRSDEAEPLLAEARETFERLGAQPSLDRIAK